MLNMIYVYGVAMVFLLFSCQQATDAGKQTSVEATDTDTAYTDGGYAITSYYPFSVLNDPRHTIAVYLYNVEDSILVKYVPLFEKYGYSGNGESWAGHIEQILEKKDPELLAHIQFDPEADAFFASFDSKDYQMRAINLLVPIFKDLGKLEQYLKSADSDRIWD